MTSVNLKRWMIFFIAVFLVCFIVLPIYRQTIIDAPMRVNLEKFTSVILPKSFHAFRDTHLTPLERLKLGRNKSVGILDYEFLRGDYHFWTTYFNPERIVISFYSEEQNMGDSQEYITHLNDPHILDSGWPTLNSYKSSSLPGSFTSYPTPIQWVSSFAKENFKIEQAFLKPEGNGRYPFIVCTDPRHRVRIFYLKKNGSFNKMIKFVLQVVESIAIDNRELSNYFTTANQYASNRKIINKNVISTNIAAINAQLAQNGLPIVENGQKEPVVSGPYIYGLVPSIYADVNSAFLFSKVLGTSKPSPVNSGSAATESTFDCISHERFGTVIIAPMKTDFPHDSDPMICKDRLLGVLYVFEGCASKPLGLESPFDLSACFDSFDKATSQFKAQDPNFQPLN